MVDGPLVLDGALAEAGGGLVLCDAVLDGAALVCGAVGTGVTEVDDEVLGCDGVVSAEAGAATRVSRASAADATKEANRIRSSRFCWDGRYGILLV